MSTQFANYEPIQGIQIGGGDSVIRISQNISESVSFPDPTQVTETITETVTVQVT